MQVGRSHHSWAWPLAGQARMSGTGVLAFLQRLHGIPQRRPVPALLQSLQHQLHLLLRQLPRRRDLPRPGEPGGEDEAFLAVVVLIAEPPEVHLQGGELPVNGRERRPGDVAGRLALAVAVDGLPRVAGILAFDADLKLAVVPLTLAAERVVLSQRGTFQRLRGTGGALRLRR